ncbi:hypothetical protein FQN53_009444 [Emmonsiellopsis sp. PD_33]|nr:hypothetical protein FQN53_009444 [Emmonsiellopsis sp. PD_33]
MRYSLFAGSFLLFAAAAVNADFIAECNQFTYADALATTTGLRYLAERTDSAEWTVYQDQLYIDASTNAYAPLRFTPDNTTLADGETSWAWWDAMGVLLWTPTGDPKDGTERGEGTVLGQGFTLVDVDGYPGLKQAYWNQTMFDEMYAGRWNHEGYLTICHKVRDDPSIVHADRP